MFSGVFRWSTAATLWLVLPQAGAQLPDEDHVRAAMLVQLARFVEWPPHTRADRFRICVLGGERHVSAFRVAAASETVDGRHVEVLRADRLTDVVDCDIAFIGAASDKDKQALLERQDRTGMLLVSPEEGFAARGGMVGLVTEKGRIVMEVNREAAERAGLRFSSKLLRLVRIVKTRGQS